MNKSSEIKDIIIKTRVASLKEGEIVVWECVHNDTEHDK